MRVAGGSHRVCALPCVFVHPETNGYRTVSFLSDYGLQDEFVGVTKSVVWSFAPDVRIVDITHQVPAYNVRAGGLALARSAQYLNPGVVLAVVDPGVGSARRGVAVEVGDGMSVLVGPDNGLLAPAVAMVGGASRAWDITDSAVRLSAPGPTFDGRDLFAPVAGHLASGVAPAALGTEIDPALLVPSVVPVAELADDAVTAEVLWIDRFGNAQLNLAPEEIAASSAWGLTVNDRPRPARVVSTFEDIESGEIGLLTDSYGMVSLAVNRGSAALDLGLVDGTIVQLSLREADSRGTTTPVSLSPRLERPE